MLNKPFDENWKHDLLVAVGSAFFVTLFSKIAEELGDVLVSKFKKEPGDKNSGEDEEDSSAAPSRQNSERKCACNAPQSPTTHVESSTQATLPTNSRQAFNGHSDGFKGNDLPLIIESTGQTVFNRTTGEVYYCTGVVYGHKAKLVDCRTLEKFEDAVENYGLMNEKSSGFIPAFKDWKEINEDTPDGALVANSFWDFGPGAFGRVKRINDEICVVPSLKEDVLESFNKNSSNIDGYKIVPPLLAIKIEIDI
jgi:hypothetical protein